MYRLVFFIVSILFSEASIKCGRCGLPPPPDAMGPPVAIAGLLGSLLFPPLLPFTIGAGMLSTGIDGTQCINVCRTCSDVPSHTCEDKCLKTMGISLALDVATMGSMTMVTNAAKAVQAGQKGAQLLNTAKGAKMISVANDVYTLTPGAPVYDQIFHSRSEWQKCIDETFK